MMAPRLEWMVHRDLIEMNIVVNVLPIALSLLRLRLCLLNLEDTVVASALLDLRFSFDELDASYVVRTCHCLHLLGGDGGSVLQMMAVGTCCTWWTSWTQCDLCRLPWKNQTCQMIGLVTEKCIEEEVNAAESLLIVSVVVVVANDESCVGVDTWHSLNHIVVVVAGSNCLDWILVASL